MQHVVLNNIDYAVIIIVAISMIIGFLRGFMASVLSFMGWIASLYFSYAILPHTKELFASKISNPILAMTAGYGISLLIMLVVFGILNIFFMKAIDSLRYSFFDRILGLIFGAVRGGVIIGISYCMFTMVWNFTNSTGDDKNDGDYPSFITDAYTHHLMVISKDAIIDLLPKDFNEQIDGLYKALNVDKANKDLLGADNGEFIDDAKKQADEYIDSLNDDNLSDDDLEKLIDEDKGSK